MTLMDNGAFDYVETGVTNGYANAERAVSGAGNNPSTWAGVLVLGALVVLSVTRKSFRRFM